MDSRTPPPGIEVIGELPPGTPWWDAEQLGIKRGRLGLWGWVAILPLITSTFGLCILVLYGVQAFELIPLLIRGAAEADVLNKLFYIVALIAVGSIVLGAIALPIFAIDQIAAALLTRHIVIIDRVEAKWLMFKSLRQLGRKDGREVEARVQLVNLQMAPFGRQERSSREIASGAASAPEGLEFFGPGLESREGAGRRIGSGGDLDPRHLHSLFTYRIAKAKGENHPPPEFL